MNIAKFLGTLFCRTPVMTASVTFNADIHLAKLFTIIENKADFFSIKNKDITFKILNRTIVIRTERQSGNTGRSVDIFA